MGTTDPTRLALTGTLPFLLLVATALTWPLASLLLVLYTRAVRRCMHRGTPTAEDPPLTSPAPVVVDAERAGWRVQFRDVRVDVEVERDAAAHALLNGLTARPRDAAIVYLVAGLLAALIIAMAQLLAAGIPVLPIRTLMLAWVFSWPVVPVVAIVAARDRRDVLLLVVAYVAGLCAIGAAGMRNSPDLTWGQVAILPLTYDVPPMLLLWTCLARRVRSVGPLVLAFCFTAIAGSNLVVTEVGSHDEWLRRAIDLTALAGLGAIGTLVVMVAVGFAMFGALAWIGLRWIGRRYQAKKISDESVTVDAVMLIFMLAYSIDLVFEGPLTALAGVGAYVVFKACTRGGFAWLRSRPTHEATGPALLVLRSFALGRDSRRLFAILQRHWRRSGSLQLIAGVDLATGIVEPHEFLDFVAGRLSRRFIDGPEALARRLAEHDGARDRDLRFRVNDYFCFDTAWKAALASLVLQSDAIVMDLRGFSSANTGCVFEIGELAARTPLDRVVFIVDAKTDRQLLADTLARAPSADGGSTEMPRVAHIIELPSLGSRHVRALLAALARAVMSASALTPTSQFSR